MCLPCRMLLSLVVSLVIFSEGQAKTIQVSSQTDFDKLSTSIVTLIKAGDDSITVNLAPGYYYYKNKHILLQGINRPHLSIRFTGRNAVVMGQGGKVNNFSRYEYLYLDGQNLVDSWTEFYQAKDTIEIVDAKKHLCRIKHEGLADQKEVRNKQIQVTLWFKSAMFPITEVKNGFVYFNAGEYATPINGYAQTINYDYAYAKKYPRYRLFGFSKTNEVYECRAACFLDIEDSKIKSLELTGLIFNGCSRDNHLININNVQADNIDIKNCLFSNIGGAVVYIVNSNNVTFENNSVQNTFGSAIVSNNGSSNTSVTKNEFRNLDLKMTNSHGVLIQGNNFLIAENLFENFSYSAVGVGIHYKTKSVNPCAGRIYNNEIYLTGDYLARPEQHTLMDGGAIYLWTQNDGISIENNYIHDIVGMKDNRGIFCDDGTKNVTITGNIIERIGNSYCICLRECAYVEPFVSDYNSKNVVEDNFVDGDVRFFKKDSTCKYDGSSSTNSIWFYFSRPYWRWRSRR